MKLKVIPRRQLTGGEREIPDAPPFRRSDAPLEEKKERLYRAIERTRAFMNKRVPPDEAMKAIRRRYPAPVYFIESNSQALERAGIPRLEAFYYAMIPGLTRTSLSQQWGMRPRLDRLWQMRRYVTTLYVGVHVECFYLILLDGQGRLIRSALMQRGGIDNAPFYLGQLLDTALREKAKYIALAHNHPGGTLRPSKEDLRCTLRALNAFAPLKIPLLDHLIVAGTEVVSIRETGMLPEVLWTAVSPGNRAVKRWLEAE